MIIWATTLCNLATQEHSASIFTDTLSIEALRSITQHYEYNQKTRSTCTLLRILEDLTFSFLKDIFEFTVYNTNEMHFTVTFIMY
jgi:hypothetical protein